MRRPRASLPMWVRKSTPRPSRASPTATFSGLPPTCSPVTCAFPLDDVDQRLADDQRALRAPGAVMASPYAAAISNVARAPSRCSESSAHRYASTNRGCDGEIAEHVGVFDERRRVLVLRPGQRHQRVGQLVLDVDGLALLVDAFGVARPAGDGRRRQPDRTHPCSRFSRITGSSHFGMRSDEPKHSRAMVSLTPGLANRSISVRL